MTGLWILALILFCLLAVVVTAWFYRRWEPEDEQW